MAKNFEVSLLLDFYGELLTEKQRESVEYYYNDDLSLGEIAANLGISRQGVRDNIKRAETILFEMEEKLGLMAKFSALREDLSVLRKSVDMIDDRNIKIYRSKDINESIKIILKTLDKISREI